MRKFLFLLILMLGIGLASADAQTYYYRTTSFAYKYANSYGNWTNWSDWQESSLRISIDFDNDVIKIFSPKTQVYVVVSRGERYTDASGGSQIIFSVIDQDGDRGSIRFRVERNGNSQLYVDFADAMWVYNVVKT